MGSAEVLDRARGALGGLACGDAVGTTLEFQAPGSFTPITDMVGGGPFGLQPGQWTDDTSMALCLAESLVDRGANDLVDQLRRYVAWRREGSWSSTGRCFDIGGTTSHQLDRFERTGEPVDPHVDQESAANGSLMRLAGVPIRWHTDVERAATASAESSRSTHPAGRPVDACRVLGAMTAALVAGADPEAVFAPELWQWGPLHPAVEAVARGSWRGKEPPAIRGTGYCVDAFEAAIWAVAGAADFAAAVLRAANLGDDADTTAAIAGQLAGARWGWSGIPVGWRTKVTFAARITSLAEELAVAADPSLRGRWSFDREVHAWWVEPGRLLAGEYPGARTDAKAAEKLGLLVDAGMRTFVDLTAPADGMRDYHGLLARIGAERGLTLAHVRRPIPDMGTNDAASYREVVARIDAGIAGGGTYVHCWGGMGRTATVVGCWLVDHGHAGDEALRRVAELRAGTRKEREPAPQTEAQRAVVRSHAPP